MRSLAFTLIELMLVTIIILALVSLSIPLFKRTFSDLSAKDTAFNISKLLAYAQERSVIDRKNYRATFDFNRRQYQLLESSPSADGIAYKTSRSRFGKAFTLPQGLFFHDPATDVTQKASEEYKKQVIIYPDGHCDELSIDLIDKQGYGYNISLKGLGSLARIKEVTREPR